MFMREGDRNINESIQGEAIHIEKTAETSTTAVAEHSIAEPAARSTSHAHSITNARGTTSASRTSAWKYPIPVAHHPTINFPSGYAFRHAGSFSLP